jgi:hypothetical protein
MLRPVSYGRLRFPFRAENVDEGGLDDLAVGDGDHSAVPLRLLVDPLPHPTAERLERLAPVRTRGLQAATASGSSCTPASVRPAQVPKSQASSWTVGRASGPGRLPTPRGRARQDLEPLGKSC